LPTIRQIKYVQLNSDVFTGLLTVSWPDLFVEYCNHKKLRGLQPTSLYESLATIQRFEQYANPATSRHFTQSSVDAFLLQRAEQSISTYTLNKDISNLRAFAHWSAERRYTAEVKLRKLKVDPPAIRVLTDDQLKLLLCFLVKFHSYFIRVLLAISTGLRRGDIESLSIADIDLDACAISSHSRKTRKAMPARPLPAAIAPLLSGYLKTLPAGQSRLFADIFRSKKWRRLRIAAGLPDVTFQDMRKTFSSNLARAGVGDSVIQHLLEHSSPVVSGVHYINVDPVLASAVERLPVNRWLPSAGFVFASTVQLPTTDIE
jgi:integrase